MLVTEQTNLTPTSARVPLDLTALAKKLGVSPVTIHRLADAGLIEAGPARGPRRSRMIPVDECDRIANTLKAARAVSLPLSYAFRLNARLDGSRVVFEPWEGREAVSA